MTQQHTKGPWQDNDEGLIFGQVSGDTDIAPFVCDVCDNPGSGVYTEQEKANARLIAAAPELLEALEEVVNAPPEGWSIKEGMKLLIKCRDVIAKAKGA